MQRKRHNRRSYDSPVIKNGGVVGARAIKQQLLAKGHESVKNKEKVAVGF